jgi:hypothetical protein
MNTQELINTLRIAKEQYKDNIALSMLLEYAAEKIDTLTDENDYLCQGRNEGGSCHEEFST